MLLEDIGNPSSDQVAKTLGVSVDLVRTWCELDEAPRPVALAIFWLTRWGHSAVDCEAANAAALALQRLAAAQREETRLLRQLAQLLAAADFGCANEPMFA